MRPIAKGLPHAQQVDRSAGNRNAGIHLLELPVDKVPGQGPIFLHLQQAQQEHQMFCVEPMDFESPFSSEWPATARLWPQSH